MSPGARRRVLVVAWWYPSPEDPVGGIFVREQVRAIAKVQDVAVVAFAPGRPDGAPLRLAPDRDGDVPVVRVVYRRLPGPASALLYLPGALLALRRLRAAGFRPDLVHAHVFLGGVVGALLARRRLPLVVSEHFSGFQLGSLTRAEKLAARAAFRAADVVAPVSEALRRAIEPYTGSTAIRVVPNVVDTNLFHPGPRDAAAAAARILFVGNLEEVKGVRHLLAEAVELRDGGRAFTLELIGGGSRRAEYERLAGDLGLGDVARFRGPLPQAGVADAMRAADVLVLPSLTETFGTVAAEALASGLPVVASRTGAIPEIVSDDAGLLVPVADPAALAAAIASVLDRRDDHPGERLARSVRARFNADAVAAVWDRVYTEATERCRR